MCKNCKSKSNFKIKSHNAANNVAITFNYICPMSHALFVLLKNKTILFIKFASNLGATRLIFFNKTQWVTI